ncbi:hypothetical protein V5F34_03395 [Xanthobacter autotrophicus]
MVSQGDRWTDLAFIRLHHRFEGGIGVTEVEQAADGRGRKSRIGDENAAFAPSRDLGDDVAPLLLVGDEEILAPGRHPGGRIAATPHLARLRLHRQPVACAEGGVCRLSVDGDADLAFLHPGGAEAAVARDLEAGVERRGGEPRRGDDEGAGGILRHVAHDHALEEGYAPFRVAEGNRDRAVRPHRQEVAIGEPDRAHLGHAGEDVRAPSAPQPWTRKRSGAQQRQRPQPRV